VDLLQDNPDWRWYILVVAVLLITTLTGWLVFKYNPVSDFPNSPIFRVYNSFAEYRSLSHGLNNKQTASFFHINSSMSNYGRAVAAQFSMKKLST
jgi:hypothetical protein